MIAKPTLNDHPIDDLLKDRWSPLAFDERALTQETLDSLFEAARWSPSCMNEQPWRFLVGAKNGDPDTYAKILDCLMPANQLWASTAPALMIVLSAKNFARNGQENRFALYDAGQAVAHLTIEAMALGVFLHQMGGFDAGKARAAFGIPEDMEIGAAVALGYQGDPALLADEKYRERHVNPARVRRPLSEIVLTGAGAAFGTPSPLV